MAWSRDLIDSGARYKIYALKKGDRCDVNDFLKKCKKSNLQKYTTLMALIRYIANNGPPNNKTQFKKLHSKDQDVYEIKIKPFRIFCCFHNHEIILTHGWKKEGNRKAEQNEQIKIASDRCAKYLDSLTQELIKRYPQKVRKRR